MKRRTFVLGMGSATAGGSALLATGAFSRVEAHRTVDIQVAGDDSAYLQLYGNSENPFADDVVVDDGDGHLTLALDSLNEHADVELDSLFTVCNHGKQPVCLWIEKEAPVVQCKEKWGWKHGGHHGKSKGRRGKHKHRDAIRFYRGDDPDQRFDSLEGRTLLGVGECVQVGVDLCTVGIDEGTELLPGGVTVLADVDADCSPAEESEDPKLPGISSVTFCGPGLTEDDLKYWPTLEKSDGDAVAVGWKNFGSGTVETVVLKAGTSFYNFDADGANGGVVRVGDVPPADVSESGQSPSKPCPGGTSGVKFEL